MKGKPLRFQVRVHRVHDGYVARVVEFPGCVARGATAVEAIENARSAVRNFLSVTHLLGSEPVVVQVEITA
jgi:predicted RNase H-like HicB family nuclease